jgi:hypothetical protein
MSLRLLEGLLALGLVLCAGGCNVQKDPERNSGPDKDRLGAIECPINATIVDNVDRNRGDMTDWKYFFIPSPAVVEVIIAFDNANAKAIAVIREATGVQKTLIEHRGEPILKNSFRAKPGVYYIQIYARQESTDYTLEIMTQ